MKNVLITFAFFTLLTAGCATREPEPLTNYAADSVSVEIKVNEDDLSFWDVPHLEEAQIYTAPKERNDGVVVGKLGAHGSNKNIIVELAQEIAADQHGDYDSLLIVHEGRLVFESYYLGGRINLTHPQVSATKSYTSLALGRAIQLGYLTMDDLNKPLVSFLKDLNPAKFVEGVEKITLHQALSMRSGIRVSKEDEEEFKLEPSQLLGQGHVQTYLENSASITDESQSFKYQGDPMLVMQVIEAVVPGSAKDFIKNELFAKLGITTYNWQTDISGLPIAGARSSITSRAMVKLGTLAINNGKWKGEQLIPEAFMTKATNSVVHTSDDDIFGGGEALSNSGYGYFWWQADMRVGDRTYFSTSAQGGGGQYIILIDELDLIVVATAHEPEVTTLQMTAERILPAFIE
ncbi:MAG: serine hydrolase domain-containing protein [Gammaproteobacteria bacterium]